MDEVQFASSVIQSHEWSPVGINYKLHKVDLTIKVVKLILGISKERWIEASYLVDGKLDSGAMIHWLNKIDSKKGIKPVVLMDNASYHRSNAV